MSRDRSDEAESFEEESVIERLRTNSVPLRANEIFALQVSDLSTLINLNTCPLIIDHF